MPWYRLASSPRSYMVLCGSSRRLTPMLSGVFSFMNRIPVGRFLFARQDSMGVGSLGRMDGMVGCLGCVGNNCGAKRLYTTDRQFESLGTHHSQRQRLSRSQ